MLVPVLLAWSAVAWAAAPAAAALPGEAARSWPVAGAARGTRPVVVHGWDPPPSPWAAGHRGVDLATRAGRPVRAAAAGRVSFAGQVAGRGVVSVELSGTGRPPLRTTYEPVRPSVRAGEKVRAGEVLGRVQNGPFHCAEACLHWGLRRGEAYRDPLTLLPAHMLRGPPPLLLPVFGIPLPESGGRSPGARAASVTAGTADTADTSGGSGTSGRSGTSGDMLLIASALGCAAGWAHRRLHAGRARGRCSAYPP